MPDRKKMEQNMRVEFTNEEASALAELLDIAVKTGGIRVAPAALTIMHKLQNAAKPEEKETANGD